MYVATVEREVESAGFSETASFRIAANAKAFRILIDKLYSDIHVAIVRELLSNAFDAHILSGTSNVPPRLHIPNVLEPHFSLRDFGCSMTHHQVMTLYSTIFESTKDQRNDQVGAWGMGSKTPFGYTDTFGVQCWLDGVTRIYSVFIDNHGVPKIALAHTEVTSEPNGVEISFPVQGKDFAAFKYAIASVLIGFDVMPEFTGGTVELYDKTVRLAGPDWTVYDYNEPITRAHARQGCVLYPLSRDPLASYVANGLDQNGSKYPQSVLKLFSDATGIYSMPIILDFPIGSVEVTANREELAYAPGTCQAIISRFTGMFDGIVAKLQDDVNKCATFRDACEHVFGFILDSGYSESIRGYLEDSAKALRFRGHPLRTHFKLMRLMKLEEITDPITKEVTSKTHILKFGNVNFSMSHASELFKRNRRSVKFYSVNDIAVRFDNNFIVYVEIINDRGKGEPGFGARAWHDATTAKGPTPSILWVKTPSVEHIEFRRLLAYLGRPKWKLGGTLPLPPKDSEGYRGITQMKVLDGYRFVDFKLFDIERDAGYYVPLKRGEVDYPGDSKITESKLSSLVSNLMAAGKLPKDFQVIGVPASRKSLLTQSDDWIDALPELTALYYASLDLGAVAAADYIDKALSSRAGATKYVMAGDDKVMEMLNSLAEGHPADIKKRIPASPFVDALDAVECIQAESKKLTAHRVLYNARTFLPYDEHKALEQLYAMTTMDPTKSNDLIDMALNIIEANTRLYPLLKTIAVAAGGNSHVHYDLQLLCEYIALVDKSLTGCGKCGNVTPNEKVPA